MLDARRRRSRPAIRELRERHDVVGRRAAASRRRRGRAAARRPQRKAAVFIATAAPFSSIARSSAVVADRDQALLLGVAQHEHVGGDGIAHQRRGELGRVEEVAGARRRPPPRSPACSVSAGKAQVGLAGEVAGDGLVRVDDGARGAGLAASGQRIGAGARRPGRSPARRSAPPAPSAYRVQMPRARSPMRTWLTRPRRPSAPGRAGRAR